MEVHEPAVRKITLRRDKTYRARLIWRKPGYSEVALKGYYIFPLKTHCYFYDDVALTKLKGCFPLHWFNDFQEISNIIEETSLEDSLNLQPEGKNCSSLELGVDTGFQQLTLF
ncbi:sugar ABC transporter (plasmid) [Bacillus sp. S3]|uniref:sugar ABC transporter n=1 Tax=Bacillus sp. S3 TaxID=486398 RepID=UPI001189D969|nr:sugar ABC transporter [Bacillus sp. S3]QCJ45585.1 sugar ABC transporter [Bacillus sp. S3]